MNQSKIYKRHWFPNEIIQYGFGFTTDSTLVIGTSKTYWLKKVFQLAMSLLVSGVISLDRKMLIDEEENIKGAAVYNLFKLGRHLVSAAN